MADLRDFSQRMRVLGLQVTDGADKAVRRVALAIDQAVVVATPVDTGRARSNWLVSVGAQIEDTIAPYAPGTKGSTAAQNVSQALEQAKGAVSGYRGGSAIYISNNLPYIQRLNDGWSAQAPVNYVEAAVDAAVAAIGTVRILSP